MKNRKKILILTGLALFVVAAIFTSLASEDIKGAVRARRNPRTQISTPVIPAQAPIQAPTSTANTNTSQPNTMAINAPSAATSANFSADGYTHPLSTLIRQIRLYDTSCPYFAEIGKWKLTVTGAPFRLQQIPLLVETTAGTTSATRRVGTQYKLFISQNPEGGTPLHSFSKTTTDTLFEFQTGTNGITLNPGTYYVSLETKLEPTGSPVIGSGEVYYLGGAHIAASAWIDSGNQQINDQLGTFTENNQSVFATLGQGVTVGTQPQFKLRKVSTGFNICSQAADPGPGGGVGMLLLSPNTTQPQKSENPIHVSDTCLVSNNYEPIGQWKMQLSFTYLTCNSIMLCYH